jgi:hypothetical protein
MYGVAPIALIGGLARFRHPERPFLRGYGRCFRNNVLKLRIPPDAAVDPKGERQHCEWHQCGEDDRPRTFGTPAAGSPRKQPDHEKLVSINP